MMNNTLRAFCGFLLLFLIIINESFSQFLHRSGKQIVDANGKEVILRGMGLGGWMLQEGYMLETNGFANPQHQIRARIAELVGEASTNEFYEAWLKNHCTKRDIDSLASWGFNSVRLPMHYNLFTLPIEKEPVKGQHTWLEKGFQLTDNLLEWCKANNMYLILDLHAAPGGQGNDAAISDYDVTKPSLWQSEENKQKTIALWRKLAERYANEKWIGGYDLINETNWPFEGNNKNGCDEQNNAPLKKLLIDITTAIREVDKNHLIFIEGNCWANNHNGLLPYWDDNIALSFHKYWNYNDQNSLQNFINLRDQYNVPLWLGESGENSNVWFRNAIALMENNHVGWAWWPMKKVNSVVNPLTIVKNEGYEKLLNYWKNGGVKPSPQEAKGALMQLAENLKIENNIYRKDVVDAMFRQVHDNSTIPFKHHKIPGIVNASDYDLGRYGKAYVDIDTATYHVSTGSGYSNWNNGWSYRNDGVDIQPTSDNGGNGFQVGWTADGEWLQYTVDVDSSAAYNVNIRYASPNANPAIRIFVNNIEKTPIKTLPSTGGYTNFTDLVISDLILYKGQQKIKVYFQKGGANVTYLKFAISKKAAEISLRAVSAHTESEQGIVRIALNKSVNPATVSSDEFTLMVNGKTSAIQQVTTDVTNENLLITIGSKISDADVLKINYSGSKVKGIDGTSLEKFSDLQVLNTLPFHWPVPGKLEAENYIINQGLQFEITSDTGGGQNAGYTSAGDYLEYNVRVDRDGLYKLEARIACNNQAGKIEIKQLSKDNKVLNTATLEVPVTGGWQLWKTISTTMKLDSGASVLRVTILQPEFNINWFNFTTAVINSIEKTDKESLNIFPNPVDGVLSIQLPEKYYKKDNTLTIRDSSGRVIKKFEKISKEALKKIDITSFTPGLYLVEFKTGDQTLTNKFTIK
ncbi:carbohydrate-binding protein [Chryseosolibacter indicus]|uniref:Carbohydrate-binding protein n=1 Tax=Chryseosolibacter indicus TaxID=2782351 RepID=A0ABS5VL56_9BACT|nr:carbohydrate-binding protein [Chryseosolibacter indicus]MBT1702180.1 carbohydrate-binding protein [Chryseosolibacter indicus]